MTLPGSPPSLQVRPQPVARRALSLLLLATGVALLVYVGVQYGQMLTRQQQLKVQWQQQATSPAFREKPAGTGLTRLKIPKISLDAMVAEGTSRKELLLGPGHLEKTAFPGESGNAVIAAHRDTFFRHISELDQGDEIVVERNGRTFRYEVTGKKVVKPEAVSVIAPSRDARLTLITCYPTYYIGHAPERLVVFSKLRP
jgi:sortase A